jgi:nitrite reductase/ring-hydroxylating ferredoxin subunit
MGARVRHVFDQIPVEEAQFPLLVRAGDQEVAVFRTPGGFRAIERWCPHQATDLLTGTVLQNGNMIRCPSHGYVFRFSNGEAINCRGCVASVYEVTIENGRLVLTARERQEIAPPRD